MMYVHPSVCPSGLGGNIFSSVPNKDRGLISSSFATYGCCHPCLFLECVAQFYFPKLPDLTNWFPQGEIQVKRYQMALHIQVSWFLRSPQRLVSIEKKDGRQNVLIFLLRY